MQLRFLMEDIPIVEFRGDPETEIFGLTYDSREVQPGFAFVALKGHSHDGHGFLGEAVSRGASALVLEDAPVPDISAAVMRVKDTRAALSHLAVRFYRRPFEGIDLIGVTGTNGKTTTTYLLESVLAAAGKRPGVIGTVNYRFGGRRLPAPVTTPESLDLLRILREMADSGVSHVVMEVSSHALDQGRTRDCPFRGAVFTNVSRDHLDYHGSMEAYFQAKSRLFRGLKERACGGEAFAVINLDDPRGRELVSLTDGQVLTYGLQKGCDLYAEDIRMTRQGISARLKTPGGDLSVRSSLVGGFNVHNILAACGAAMGLHIPLEHIGAGIERLAGVPGRMESVPNRRLLTILVDYAHTPDALWKALDALRPLTAGRLISVFGCGGDRDRGKRREMGRVAARLSDLVVVTSDNPRTEDAASIVREIEEGVREVGAERLESLSERGRTLAGYMVEVDRERAIRMAVRAAGSQDVVLIAGKGHEDYQIVGRRKRHFDDREVAALAASEGE
jgi:UDP-N-acetylmuramoyl-L-alanyl-D-glutamate--2,6-diaminopimelate ligase